MYNTREDVDALGRALRPSAGGVRCMSDLRILYQEVSSTTTSVEESTGSSSGRAISLKATILCAGIAWICF